MSLLMIHEAYMPVYIGSRFSLRTYVRVGPPEVVQEALADLKRGRTSSAFQLIVNICLMNHQETHQTNPVQSSTAQYSPVTPSTV